MDNPVRGFAKLSKAQLVHLIQSRTLEHDKFVQVLEFQRRRQEAKGIEGPECWMCQQIAIRLGLWDKEGDENEDRNGSV